MPVKKKRDSYTRWLNDRHLLSFRNIIFENRKHSFEEGYNKEVDSLNWDEISKAKLNTVVETIFSLAQIDFEKKTYYADLCLQLILLEQSFMGQTALLSQPDSYKKSYVK